MSLPARRAGAMHNAMTPFHVVIPARHASTRLPGKPLADIAGKPMVVRVAERAAASGAAGVHVATDDARIFDAVAAAGFGALMTRADHPSGTDRLAEAARLLGLSGTDIVVNVQGDEPLIAPSMVGDVAALLARTPAADIATACHALASREEMFNPNVVKLVMDANGMARYFSRAPIPWARDAFATGSGSEPLPASLPAYRHIGIYAYRVSFLERYTVLAPSPLEQAEALEQLRAMWHGHGIVVDVRADPPAPGVDTPEDLAAVRAIFARTGVK